MRRGQFNLDVPSSRVWVFQPVIDSINVTSIVIIIQFIIKVIIVKISAVGVYVEGHCYDYMFQERDAISIRETALCHSKENTSTAVDVPVYVIE